MLFQLTIDNCETNRRVWLAICTSAREKRREEKKTLRKICYLRVADRGGTRCLYDCSNLYDRGLLSSVRISVASQYYASVRKVCRVSRQFILILSATRWIRSSRELCTFCNSTYLLISILYLRRRPCAIVFLSSYGNCEKCTTSSDIFLFSSIKAIV